MEVELSVRQKHGWWSGGGGVEDGISGGQRAVLKGREAENTWTDEGQHLTDALSLALGGFIYLRD